MRGGVRRQRRRGAWRLRGVLALGVLAFWFAAPWSVSLWAQSVVPTPANPGDFPQCIQGQVTARAGSAPGAADRNFFEDPDTLLTAVWVCAGHYADREIVPIGQAMLGGLVIIMIVWTGIGFMFSGEFDLGALLGTVFLAGFGFMILDNYFFASPAAVPWLPAGERTNGFVAMFPDQAVIWGDLIMGDADEQFQRAFTEAQVSAAETYLGGAARAAGDPDRIYADAQGSGQPVQPAEAVGGVMRRMALMVRLLGMSLMKTGLSFVLWLVGWMIYAQYVWGFLTLAVLTVLGPLFIPFMMITQLDFLFWGWFKGLINGVIYMLTASAMYAAVAMLLVAPLQRIAQAPLPGDPGSVLGVLELFMRLFLEYVPMVVMCLFAALKVNAVSGMIVAGGSPAGSGLASGLTKAQSGLATLAGRYGAPRAAAPPVALSQVTGGGPTPQQRAAGAYQDARQRAGAPSRPRPGGSSGGLPASRG